MNQNERPLAAPGENAAERDPSLANPTLQVDLDSPTESADTTKVTKPTTSKAPIPNFITQTDAHGRQLTSVTEDDEIPPPVADQFLVASEQEWCCSILVRYLCCIDVDDTFLSAVPKLLEDQKPIHRGKPCLVLDLDETLVHSAFEEIREVDFKLEIKLEKRVFPIYVVRRPGVEELLKELSEYYELVVFTASVGEYAKKVLEVVDANGYITYQLYREHCTYHDGNFVKDLRLLNRNIERTIIVDNSPICYMFQPENAIAVSTFINDKRDREMIYLKEFLLRIKDAKDIRKELRTYSKFIEDKYREDYEALHGPLSMPESQAGSSASTYHMA